MITLDKPKLRGRIDLERLRSGIKHPNDTEERPVITPEDIAASLALRDAERKKKSLSHA